MPKDSFSEAFVSFGYKVRYTLSNVLNSDWSRLASLYELSKQIDVIYAYTNSMPSKGPEDASISCGNRLVSSYLSLDSSCALQLGRKRSLHCVGRLYCIFARVPEVINFPMIFISTVLLFVW